MEHFVCMPKIYGLYTHSVFWQILGIYMPKATYSRILSAGEIVLPRYFNRFLGISHCSSRIKGHRRYANYDVYRVTEHFRRAN